MADRPIGNLAALLMQGVCGEANRILPLPAYMLENEHLLYLLEIAAECGGGSSDLATPAFIAATKKELIDRGISDETISGWCRRG